MGAYYAKMRLGDLLGIVRHSKKNKYGFKIQWVEKSATANIEEYVNEKCLIKTTTTEAINQISKML